MPPSHMSAVETLRRSKPFSSPRLKFCDDSAVNSSLQPSLPKCAGISTSADTAMACCTVPRALNGKRRLSTSRRDDSSSGCERQRKYFGNLERKLSPSCHPSDARQSTGHEASLVTDDSVISQYLSFKVERMDLQSDVPSAETPPSPKWTPACKNETINGNAIGERRPRDPDTGRGYVKYRQGAHEAHRTGGRRYRKPSVSRTGVSDRDATSRRDDKRLENFFSHMGMDSQTLSATLSGSMSAFENVSSVDTSTLESRTSYAESDRIGDIVLESFDVNERDAVTSSSVVERNARIIKWLCSIHKASAGDDVQFDEGFV